MNPKIKIIASAIVIILCAAIGLEFGQIKYVNDNGTISVGRIEVRLGDKDWIEQRPWPTVNPFYRALAWYKGGSGSNTITQHTPYTDFDTYVPILRNTFYACGRIWVIYYDNGYMHYTSSTDGMAWATPTSTEIAILRPPTIYFDGTYVHIAYQKNAGASSYLYYKRGQPNSDGTITFGNEYQAASGGLANYIPTSIIVDNNGYPWIGYKRSPDGTTWYPYVTKSSTNDGTWSTPSGFPYQLSTTSSLTWIVELSPLDSSKVVVIYAYGGSQIYAVRWSGSSWNYYVNSPYYLSSSCPHLTSVRAADNNAYFTFLSSDGYIWLSRVVPDSTYPYYKIQSVSYCETSASNCAPTITYDETTGLFYVIYANYPSAGIFYKAFNLTSFSWSSRVQVCSDTNIVLKSLSAPHKRSSSNAPITAVFSTGTASPYTLKHVYIKSVQQTQFQVIVSSLSITGKYVKSKTSGIEGSANVTVKVYHNVDTNATWVLAGAYNLANDTILPYSTSFSTPWYNLLSGSYSPGSHTYYFKVEVIVQGRDSLTGERVSVSAYTTCSTSLTWQSMMAKMEDMRVLETNMVEQFTIPMYATLLVIVCLGALALVWRRPERD